MAGDIICKIKIEEHKIYKRVGADLLINKKITLLEALTGFHFELEMLDKKKNYNFYSPWRCYISR